MSELPGLHREVICGAIERRRARRDSLRNIALATIAAAIGGAVGTGAVFLAVVPMLNARASAAQVAVKELPPLGDATVDVELVWPMPLIEVQPTVSIEPAPTTGRPAFILHAEAPRFVLADVEDDWLANDLPEMIWDDDISYVIERAVRYDRLPTPIASLMGRQAAVFDDKGNRCVATVGAVSAVLTVVEDFQDKPETAEQRTDAWGYGAPSLVARLESLDGDCDGNLTAAIIVESNADPMAMMPIATQTLASDDDALAIRAHLAATQTPEYVSIQRAFEKSGGKGTWHGDSMTVTQIGSLHTGLVLISAASGGCGEFESNYAAAFRLRDGALGSRVPVPTNAPFSTLVAASDANGDGLPELFTGSWLWKTSLWTSGEAGYTSTDGAEVVAHVCPC